MTFPLPEQPETPNIEALSRWKRENLTGFTGNLTTSVKYIFGYEMVFKAGVLLIPTTDYSISGNTITLIVAAGPTDKYTITGWFRP